MSCFLIAPSAWLKAVRWTFASQLRSQTGLDNKPLSPACAGAVLLTHSTIHITDGDGMIVMIELTQERKKNCTTQLTFLIPRYNRHASL